VQLSAEDVTLLICSEVRSPKECVKGESNPQLNLGRVPCYHYTINASNLMIQEPNRIRTDNFGPMFLHLYLSLAILCTTARGVLLRVAMVASLKSAEYDAVRLHGQFSWRWLKLDNFFYLSSTLVSSCSSRLHSIPDLGPQ
jgi:hypothetical protein